MDQTIIEYFAGRQCSGQWKLFLTVMADEFTERLAENDLRALMHRVGVRFADQAALGTCETIDDLQLAMGRIWMRLEWGWVTIDEEETGLVIRHNCAPLTAAFGQNALRWSPAFLEGVYQRWFDQVGSGKELKVTQTSAPDELGCIDFRLSR